MILCPIFSSTGVTSGTNSLGEPSINVNVPACAARVPPDTGASRRCADKCVALTTFSANERE